MVGIFSKHYRSRRFYPLVLFVSPLVSMPLHVPVALVGTHYTRPELLQEKGRKARCASLLSIADISLRRREWEYIPRARE